MRLSVVIPVYNERAYIEEVVRRVLCVSLPGLDRELVLVDDGSTDGSREWLTNFSARHENSQVALKLCLLDRNRGKGAALRKGITEASGDIILIQDADLEYNPIDYPRLLEPILDGRADVVYGSRFVGDSPHRVLYFWHAVGNRLLTLLSNLFTGINLTDMECCYKAFRADILHQLSLRENSFGIEPELTAKIARMKCRIYEVGVSYSGRTYAEGKKIKWSDGIAAIWCILRYRFPG